MNRAITRFGYQTFQSFTSMTSSLSTESRSAKLKKMLVSPQLEFIMEAHSALSAKIVEETGFQVSKENAEKYIRRDENRMFFSSTELDSRALNQSPNKY